MKMNKIAPKSVKLKVLKACVVTTLLYNCEAFGPKVPDGLEDVYHKMMRAALGVRTNCPILLLQIESGCLPVRCLVLCRQLNFFRRFRSSLQPNGTRDQIFRHLLTTPSNYLKHYIELDQKYPSSGDIIAEQTEKIQSKIRLLGSDQDRHYKYWSYVQMNPDLLPSPFLNRIDETGKGMTKFRLGSHSLKIETGRWNRTPRENRLCATCGVVGDEKHAIYTCSEILRDDLNDLPPSLADIWGYHGVNKLFSRIMDAGYLS